jgi:cation diffusion facilitator family transporter
MRSAVKFSRAEVLAIASFFTALLVMGIKFAAWAMTGSVALFSDAVETIVNVIAAAIAFGSLRYSRKPADDTHPYGHHKVEYISAVIEGVLILLAAGFILHAAGKSLLAGPAMPELGAAAWAVVALGVAINLVLAFFLVREGRKARSPALEADGIHVWSDALSSLGVMAGLAIALATGLEWLDPLLAGLVAINILWQGWKLVSSSINGLMDHSADPATLAAIEQAIARSAVGAAGVHDLKTRVAARATFIDMHLTVDPAMHVATAHEICDRIESAVDHVVPKARITIHIEPAGVKDHGRSIPMGSAP